MSTNTPPELWPGHQIFVLKTADSFILVASDALTERFIEESKSDLRLLLTTCAQDLLVEKDVDDIALDIKEGSLAKLLLWSKLFLLERTMAS